MSQVIPPLDSATAVPPFRQAILRLRADGTVGAWNAGATALYGLTEGETLERPLSELLPTTWPQPEEAIAAAIAEAGGWAGPIVRRNRDGDALLVLAIRTRAPDGDLVEMSLRLPEQVVAASLAPGEDERSEQLVVLEPVEDGAGEIVDMTIVYANLEAAVSLGLVPADLVGRRGSELLPGYLDSAMFATHRRVVSTGMPVEVTDWRLEIPAGSGSEHAYTGVVVPFGRGVASRTRDVTAERRALQALDDAQARVRVALSVAPVSVGQLNERLEYEWVLDSITGRDPAELIGEPLGARSTPEDAERLRAAARRVMETGRVERLNVRGGDGLERHAALHAVVTPRTDAGGQVLGVRVALVDVSEHERLEAELDHSRDMMRAVLEQTPGAVHVVGLDGRICFINARAATLFGTTVEDAAGRAPAEFVDAQVADWMAEQDARVLRTGEAHEVRLVSGGELLLVRRFPVRDDDGQIRAIGSLAVDLKPATGLEADVTDLPAP